jgi:hypothetical protein
MNMEDYFDMLQKMAAPKQESRDGADVQEKLKNRKKGLKSAGGLDATETEKNNYNRS